MSYLAFMSPSGEWKCTKCGACCHLVGHVYPELDRGDWGCMHLERDNTCGIYPTRPALCIVPKVMKRTIPRQLARACDQLDKEFNASHKDK
jgi:Fe-S-cluster containining protein